MSEAQLTPVQSAVPSRWKLRRLRAKRWIQHRGDLIVTTLSQRKDLSVTLFQFICFLCGLFFVSFWSIPVAGVLGAALAIIAAERQ